MHHHNDEENPKFEEARSHMKAARTAFRNSIESFLPQGFIQQRREARHEMLLAMRSLVDSAIERIEKTGGETKA
jgi:hypothetical protein